MKLFKLKEVKPKIFLLEFKNEYDMCMTFLRYQEYYESPSPKFRGKKFKILDFMRYYSLTFGHGSFTYPIDWAGFNIPDWVIAGVNQLGIPDRNEYDKQMLDTWQKCRKKSNGEKFYIIGVTKGNGALNHEIAHGFYYLNSKYKKEMDRLVKKMDPNLRKAMEKYLHDVGYTPKVYVDEIQANMATAEDFGNSNRFEPKIANELKEAQKPFIEVFKRYFNAK